MKEIVHVINLSGDSILVQFKFIIEGNHLISCGTRGSICVEDFGSFPIAVAKILLESKVTTPFVTSHREISLTFVALCPQIRYNFFMKAISADLSMSRGIWRANEWGYFPPLLNLIPSPCKLFSPREKIAIFKPFSFPS